MEKMLRNFLNSLEDKYQTETELHEEISQKICDRLASFVLSPYEFAHLDKAILCHVEEAYKQLLMTKRHFRKTRKMLALSHKMSQENLEKLRQIKSSMQQIKDMVELPKGSLPILIIKKKSQSSASRQDLNKKKAAPEPKKKDRGQFPHDLCHN